MFKVKIEKDFIQISKEYFIDFLKKLNINYLVKKNNIIIKTPQETIKEGIPFPIELNDSQLFHLMKMAHEKNITFNELCNQVLREEIEKLEKAKTPQKTKKIKK